jgi:hypothetical protein
MRWLLATVALVMLSSAGVAFAISDVENEAFNAAKLLVPKAMKDPSSADFDSKSFRTRKLKSDQLGIEDETAYLVDGIVRGKNSFGAVVPSKWSAIVVEAGGELTTEVIFLDGDVIASNPKGAKMLLRMNQLKDERFQQGLRDLEDRGRAETRSADERDRINAMTFADRQRVNRVRSEGVEAGKAAAEQLGKALVRISEKEIASRAKREAVKRKVPDGDRDDFIDAFSGAVEAAKAKSSSR